MRCLVLYNKPNISSHCRKETNMKIPELVYEVRTLARKEEDPVKRDLFYQCAKSLEILGNIAKIADLAVAEQSSAEKPHIDQDGNEKYYVDSQTLNMLNEHIDALIHYGFMEKDDRWPYSNDGIKLFVSKYFKSQIVKDSNTE